MPQDFFGCPDLTASGIHALALATSKNLTHISTRGNDYLCLHLIVKALEIQGFLTRTVSPVDQVRKAFHAVRAETKQTKYPWINAHRDTRFFINRS